jgi:hypothetical protein
LYYQIFRESVIQLSDAGFNTKKMIHEKELAAAGIDINECLAAIENVLKA